MINIKLFWSKYKIRHVKYKIGCVYIFADFSAEAEVGQKIWPIESFQGCLYGE